MRHKIYNPRSMMPFGVQLGRLAQPTYWTLGAMCLLVLSACGSATTLTVKPSKPQQAELVPVPRLKQYAYKKILLLPPAQAVALHDVKIKSVVGRPKQYYTAKLEKALLQKGFEMIDPAIVARAEQGLKSRKGTLSAAEKAMIMGKETKADAVLIIQSIDVWGYARHFAIGEENATEVEPGQVRRNEDGELYHADTEECLFRLPYYEVRLEAKMVEAASGHVLWVGTGRQRTTDVLRQDWSAQLDSDCEVEQQNFIYADNLSDEATLDKTVTALFERMMTPLQMDASTGQTLVREVKAPPPPPPPPPPQEPKAKTAVVAAKRASLRQGPGRKHPRKMRVPRKAKVEVLEVMGEWMKVKIQDGTEGWMHESVLISTE